MAETVHNEPLPSPYLPTYMSHWRISRIRLATLGSKHRQVTMADMTHQSRRPVSVSDDLNDSHTDSTVSDWSLTGLELRTAVVWLL